MVLESYVAIFLTAQHPVSEALYAAVPVAIVWVVSGTGMTVALEEVLMTALFSAAASAPPVACPPKVPDFR